MTIWRWYQNQLPIKTYLKKWQIVAQCCFNYTVCLNIHCSIFWCKSNFHPTFTVCVSSSISVDISLLETWSVHHAHVASTVSPNTRPGQGRSPVTGSLNMWKASVRGRWHVVLGTVMLGTAFSYWSIRPSYQPTLSKAVRESSTLRPCFQ